VLLVISEHGRYGYQRMDAPPPAQCGRRKNGEIVTKPIHDRLRRKFVSWRPLRCRTSGRSSLVLGPDALPPSSQIKPDQIKSSLSKKNPEKLDDRCPLLFVLLVQVQRNRNPGATNCSCCISLHPIAPSCACCTKIKFDGAAPGCPGRKCQIEMPRWQISRFPHLRAISFRGTNATGSKPLGGRRPTCSLTS
jgi:hypothetical protein